MIICKRRLTLQEKHERTCHWHRWFAWHPVPVGAVMVWMQVVERRSNRLSPAENHGAYEYRMPA